MGDRAKDMTGFRSGKLVAQVREGTATGGAALWRCICDCGQESVTRGHDLRYGKVTSCGCARVHPQFKHGGAVKNERPPEYGVWEGIKKRCYQKSRRDYPRYGGRGITVCERWRGDYEAFYADMGPRPTANHSIERVDNDGNYEPDNCRWATLADQAENTRTYIDGLSRLTKAELRAKIAEIIKRLRAISKMRCRCVMSDEPGCARCIALGSTKDGGE